MSKKIVLYKWIVNHETNLMNLIKPWLDIKLLQWTYTNDELIRLIRFFSQFTTHLYKKTRKTTRAFARLDVIIYNVIFLII